MSRRLTLLLILLVAFSKTGYSVVTWSADIAPIIYNNCSYCHNSHGIAPMELMSYTDAVQNGNDIMDAVNTKEMPPWPPDPSYNHLAYERILTSQQITAINDWVNTGMLRGDSTQEQAPPVYTQTAMITNPDLVIAAPVYNVNTGNNDLYRCFVIPTNLTSDQYLTAIEAIPGNRNIVHHILIYSDTTGLPSLYDGLDPGPGYTNIAGTGSPSSKLIGAWVPGQTPYYTPHGMGIRLPANGKIIMQIHYPQGVSGQQDSTKLYLRMTPVPQREITIETPLNHYQLDNGPLVIPANTVKTFTAHATVPTDMSALSVGPHMHLIGSKIKTYGVTLAHDTIPFVDVPEWNFHWQGYYAFKNVLKIPAGTTLYSSATYNNTMANPHQPSNPPQTVTLGESTTDEMMLVYFSYTPYQAGDESIVIDSTLLLGTSELENTIVSTVQLYDPMPNPSSDKFTFQYFLPKSGTVKITVMDVRGNLVSEKSLNQSAGLTTTTLPMEGLAKGIYLLRLENDGVTRVKKVVHE